MIIMPPKIKNWWENLLDRERQMVLIGGIAVGIIFIYAAIWSPLSDAVEDNKTRFVSQQKLLQYLKKSAATIAQLKSAGIEVSAGASSDLLSTAEQTLSQDELSMYLKQVQQPKATQVQLNFEGIPFDKFMVWLQTLSTTHGAHVNQLTATKLSEIGTANVQVTLSSG